MRVPRVYTEQPISGKSHHITDRAFHHLKHVLRLKVGREVTLFDGRGGEYAAIVSAVGKDAIACEIKAYVDRSRESNFELEMAIPLVARDKLEMAIQKVVELGVQKISLIQFERSTYKIPTEKIEHKLSHLNGIVIGAVEQCGRTKLPTLNAPQSLNAWLNIPFEGLECFLHLTASEALPNERYSKARMTFGPEGGLSENESEILLDKGFTAITLGPRIMRSETACISAATLLQYQYGDFSKRNVS